MMLWVCVCVESHSRTAMMSPGSSHINIISKCCDKRLYYETQTESAAQFTIMSLIPNCCHGDQFCCRAGFRSLIPLRSLIPDPVCPGLVQIQVLLEALQDRFVSRLLEETQQVEGAEPHAGSVGHGMEVDHVMSPFHQVPVQDHPDAPVLVEEQSEGRGTTLSHLTGESADHRSINLIDKVAVLLLTFSFSNMAASSAKRRLPLPTPSFLARSLRFTCKGSWESE